MQRTGGLALAIAGFAHTATALGAAAFAPGVPDSQMAIVQTGYEKRDLIGNA